MKVKMLFFGIICDLIKSDENYIFVDLDKTMNIAELKVLLISEFGLESIQNFMIAVNESYQEDNYVIKEKDVLAIIPPVSGG